MNLLVQIQSRVRVAKDLCNKFGRFNYRNVESIYEAIKPILVELDCNLVLSDEISLIGDRFYLKATAQIKDSAGSVIGEASAYARESLMQKGMSEPQCTGSASSYARKYALGGLLLLDDSKDIDSIENKPHEVNSQNSAKLNTIKGEVALILESCGLEKKDFLAFFKFAKINKDSESALQGLLDSDLRELVNDFFNQRSENV